MIRVISFFFNKAEGGKRYDAGQIITHFTPEEEEFRVNFGHAEYVKTEKVQRKPSRKKRERKTKK